MEAHTLTCSEALRLLNHEEQGGRSAGDFQVGRSCMRLRRLYTRTWPPCTDVNEAKKTEQHKIGLIVELPSRTINTKQSRRCWWSLTRISSTIQYPIANEPALRNRLTLKKTPVNAHSAPRKNPVFHVPNQLIPNPIPRSQ